MEDKKMDRRMLRSRRQMQDALRELVAEKEYHRISVADIAEKAGVSRPTFYSHFKTRDDLLLSCFDATFEDFFEKLEDFMQSEEVDLGASFYARQLIVWVFELWAEREELIRLLLHSRAEGLVLQRFQEYTMQALQIHLERLGLVDYPEELKLLVVDCLAGVMMTLFRRWLENTETYTPELMGAMFETLMIPGLLAIFQGGDMNEWFVGEGA